MGSSSLLSIMQQSPSTVSSVLISFVGLASVNLTLTRPTWRIRTITTHRWPSARGGRWELLQLALHWLMSHFQRIRTHATLGSTRSRGRMRVLGVSTLPLHSFQRGGHCTVSL